MFAQTTPNTWVQFGARGQSADRVRSASGNGINSAGSGCRKVKIQGLDASWNIQSEIVALNGTTAQTLANPYTRVNRLEAVELGTGQTIAGTITLENTSSNSFGILTNNMTADAAIHDNRSWFSVPAGYVAVIENVHFVTGTDDEVLWRVETRKNSDETSAPYSLAWEVRYQNMRIHQQPSLQLPPLVKRCALLG